MPAADRLARNSGNEVYQLVDRHQSVGAHVQRITIRRAHPPDDSLHAVVHIAVRAGLVAVAPHFDFVTVCREGDLAADSCRGFLPAAFVGTEWAVDVVEPHYTGFQTVVFGVVPAQTLREELLPAVAIFRVRGVRVFFLQRGRGSDPLEVLR